MRGTFPPIRRGGRVVIILLFVVGLALLLSGAELLVRGSSRLAASLGISPLVIGLTVVSFGTSAPELAVSMRAALTDQAGADLALGNVVGSNICNILLILGMSAAVAPLVVSAKLVRRDVPLMIGLSFLVLLLGLDGTIGRFDGILLFSGIVAFIISCLVKGTDESELPQIEAVPGSRRALVTNLFFIAAGLVMLLLGSRWLVDGAVHFARALHVSELIIGLTIVAIGTSLPELATSVMASLKDERDIAVGNVVGSNVFNLLAVLGATAAVAPNGIPVPVSALAFDLPVMIAASVACLPIFLTGYRIDRWEGFLFLGYYGVYTLFLILASAQHDALDKLSAVMIFFILPLTVATLGVSMARERKKGNARS